MTLTAPLAPPPTSRRPPRGYFGELVDPATYRHLLYHALSLPLAVLYFGVLSSGFALGLGLLVVLVGAFVLIGMLWLLLLLADLERGLGTALLGVNLERRRAQLRPDHLWDWTRAVLSDAGTYKALLYLLLKLPFSIFVLGLVGSLLALAGALISLPYWWLYAPEQVLATLDLSSGLYSMTGWSVAALAAAGLGLLVLGVVALNLLARTWAFLSVALLTDYGEGAEAQREVQALRQGARTLAPGSRRGAALQPTLGELLAQGLGATAASGSLLLRGGQVMAQAGLGDAAAGRFAAQRPALPLGLHPGRAHLLRAGTPPFGTLVSLALDLPGSSEQTELHALYPQDTEPSRRELEFWGTLAHQAAVALETDRLISQARTQAGEQERARLARELHDSVAQALYGIALGTRAARAQLERDPARAAENLDYAVGLADGATSEMKALLFALRPDALDEGGLGAALARLSEVLRLRYRLAATLELAEEPDLSAAQKGGLYRIAQEAAHNAVKHARATRVDLSLRRDGPAWLLTVQDDGVGFDPARLAGGTLGQRSMRERAEELGAALELTTAAGAGTTVRVRLPAPLTPTPSTEVRS